MYDVNLKGNMLVKELCAHCVKAWQDIGATVTESDYQEDVWGSCEDNSCPDIV